MERRHIARELHDSAGQTLAALAMSMGELSTKANGNAALAKFIENAEGLVQHLTQEIRTTSYLLHPPMLDETGVSSALSWYVQGLGERSGLKIDLRIPDNFERLPSEMEVLIFRLVQECLTNIHRHSGSKTAQIEIAREEESVHVAVQDQGAGYPRNDWLRFSATAPEWGFVERVNASANFTAIWPSNPTVPVREFALLFH